MKRQINPQYQHLESFIDDIENAFSKSDCLLQDARNKIKKVTFNNQDFVVKSFKVPSFISRVIYSFFRASKAQRSYQYSLALADFVPKAVAYVEEQSAGLLRKSYFICEMFDYDFTIRQPLTSVDFANKDVLYRAFAQFSYALHERGVLHKDFSPGNILIKKLDDNFCFKIIDINRMDFGELSIEQRMRAFKMLWASDEDMDIIAREYALIAGFEVEQCQALAKKYNQSNKRMKNFKKRLKGKPVND